MTSIYQLKHNEVAILWYETREVEIIEVEDLHKIEDLEQYLEEHLEYDMSNAHFMS
jgi:hypothetical protein